METSRCGRFWSDHGAGVRENRRAKNRWVQGSEPRPSTPASGDPVRDPKRVIMLRSQALGRICSSNPQECISRSADQRRKTEENRDAPGRISACRSEEHTSELQSLMRISYAVCCLTKKM